MKRMILMTATVLALLVSGTMLYADGDAAQHPMSPEMMGRPNAQGTPGMMGPGMMGQHYSGMGGGMMGGGMMGHGMMSHGMMGPGMMSGGMMGMMGGGMMGMGGHGMQGLMAQLPPEKQEALQNLYVETAQQMLAQRAVMQGQMIAMHQSMTKFPVNQEALRKGYDAMQSAHSAMFELMVTATAKAQDIVGQELWQSMRFSGSPSTVMGPGTMGR